MDDLVRQGKVLYWGTSEWRAAQIGAAYAAAGQWGLNPPVVEQPQYNLLVRRIVEGELVAAAQDLGFGIVTWSPLRSGLLSGKYNQGDEKSARLALQRYRWLSGILTPEALEKSRLLGEVAGGLGVSLAQLAIGWLLRLPQVTSVITGATRVEQLTENLRAAEVVGLLSQEVLQRIESIVGPPTDPED
jgi:aryl-alcohol dehydrogenase-like predicted oxidoreductase